VSEAIKVDIWSDIACPWCYIGKRKFEEGVRRFADGTDDAPAVEIEYHSFELAPDTPVDFEGSEVDFLAGHKGLAVDQVHEMLERVGAIASSVGLSYDFDAVRHTKTLKAHQVLHLAKARGLQLDLAERLFKAYFEEGRHVGHDEDLADLAADAGLDRAEVLAALADGRYAADVVADIAQARAYGINGVPFFVLDGRYGVSGAQDPEAFAGALRQVAADRAAVTS
jgi:predicted DsbA family dithiol-disulfide isomerase